VKIATAQVRTARDHELFGEAHEGKNHFIPVLGVDLFNEVSGETL
jgi:hypothetical protein